MRKFRSRTLACVAVAGSVCVPAVAQVQPDAGSVLREQTLPRMKILPRDPTKFKVDEPVRPAMKPSANGLYSTACCLRPMRFSPMRNCARWLPSMRAGRWVPLNSKPPAHVSPSTILTEAICGHERTCPRRTFAMARERSWCLKADMAGET